jgi:hypothetical protein
MPRLATTVARSSSEGKQEVREDGSFVDMRGLWKSIVSFTARGTGVIRVKYFATRDAAANNAARLFATGSAF